MKPQQNFRNNFMRSRVARLNVRPEFNDTVIDDQGNRAYWERAAVCSCLSEDSGQPDFSCQICHGRGYRYMNPEEIIVGVQSLSSTYKVGTLELYEPGTCMITPMSNVIMGYMDKLTFPDFRCAFSEVLRFSKDVYGLGVSKPLYRNICSIVSLTDAQYEYEEGVDFKVTDDRFHIRWLTPELSEKCDGKNFSLLYITTPVYLIVDVMHELRGTRSNQNSTEVTYRELQKQYKAQREQFTYGVSSPEPVEPNSEEGEGI